MTLELIILILNSLACIIFFATLLKYKIEDLGKFYPIAACICWFNEAICISNLINSLR